MNRDTWKTDSAPVSQPFYSQAVSHFEPWMFCITDPQYLYRIQIPNDFLKILHHYQERLVQLLKIKIFGYLREIYYSFRKNFVIYLRQGRRNYLWSVIAADNCVFGCIYNKDSHPRGLRDWLRYSFCTSDKNILLNIYYSLLDWRFLRILWPNQGIFRMKF